MVNNMKKIERNKTKYIIDGREGFFISGEFHYFRVEKPTWREKLEALKQAGIMCVATYIPWILHEPSEGVFDFTSKPYLQLEEFLITCAELELYVICRPGPYQYSEIIYGGLPYWLINNYPQIKNQNIQGNPVTADSVSYMHPVFLGKAKKWFDVVCPIIARHTIENGGPVLYVQVDNELMGIHDWTGSWDYNRETMGIGSEFGRYAEFLKERYGSIENVNISYGTSFSCYAEASSIKPELAQTICDLRRMKDYQDFYFSVVAEYAALLASWVRSHGISSDIIHNSGSPYMNAFFLETVEAMDKDFILGCDHYYNLDMDWDQNNPTPRYAVKSYLSLEMLRAMGMPPTVYELPSGSCSDWPPITASDLLCCYMTNIAFGMCGFNYYVFAGGPNPEKISTAMDIYDYNAPISADGELRKSYFMIKEHHEFLNKNSWLAGSYLVTDYTIAMDMNHSRCQFEKNKGITKGIGGLDVWSFIRKGLMITGLCSSYTPGVVNILEELPTDKPLIVPTSLCMSRRAQENVINCIKRGGKVLIAPCIPEMDENYRPCTLLCDFLGCSETRPYIDFPDNIIRLNVGNVKNISISGKLFRMDSIPKGATPIAEEEIYNKNVGWIKKVDGGTVAWLGLLWKYQQKTHSRMFEYLLGLLECAPRRVVCDNPNIWAVKRKNNDREMLFIMNLFTSEFEVQITTDGTDTGLHIVPPITVETEDFE